MYHRPQGMEMGPMQHLALYVCATDTRRTKQYPFADGAEIPRKIEDAATGDTFELVMVQYEADRPQIREADRKALEAAA